MVTVNLNQIQLIQSISSFMKRDLSLAVVIPEIIHSESVLFPSQYFMKDMVEENTY